MSHQADTVVGRPKANTVVEFAIVIYLIVQNVMSQNQDPRFTKN